MSAHAHRMPGPNYLSAGRAERHNPKVCKLLSCAFTRTNFKVVAEKKTLAYCFVDTVYKISTNRGALQ